MALQKIAGWANYPHINSDVHQSMSIPEIQALVESDKTFVARGLGRSYGDASLHKQVIETGLLDNFQTFDATTGIFSCQSGVSLEEILNVVVPKGWFLPVTPGTKFVSLGGAIASDVHGKNHHVDGCFSEHLLNITIVTPTQGVLVCDRKNHPELFHATCGGMGLTGVILAATISLKPVTSAFIQQTTLKAKNLQEALELFAQHNDSTYSVAWIDCLASGDELGRSLIMLGEHAEEGELTTHSAGKLSIPFNFPSFTLNKYSIKAFNHLYYGKAKAAESTDLVHYDPYFYPLDGIHSWNKIYGKNGFLQYQFVIPKAAGLVGLTEILTKISASQQGSFLSVLKAFGKANENYLSFPCEGYTLALDFKITPSIFKLLHELDVMVEGYGGRVYLAKDSRMSERTFKATYPNWEIFQQVRATYAADSHFESLLSKRLGL